MPLPGQAPLGKGRHARGGGRELGRTLPRSTKSCSPGPTLLRSQSPWGWERNPFSESISSMSVTGKSEERDDARKKDKKNNPPHTMKTSPLPSAPPRPEHCFPDISWVRRIQFSSKKCLWKTVSSVQCWRGSGVLSWEAPRPVGGGRL